MARIDVSAQRNRTHRALIALLATLPLLIATVTVPLAHSYFPIEASSMATLARTMLVSAVVAWAAGYAGLALSQRFRQAGLRAQLAIPVLAGTLTAFAGTLVTARLMLVTEQDLVLLSLLLLFAALISLPVAWWTAYALGERLNRIMRAAESMADGRLDTRVEVTGDDEIGRLAHSFNSMASQIEQAQERQAEVERARREMLVAVSHDLRTPLSSIRAMGEAILDGVVDTQEGKQYVRQMMIETNNLSLLINDLFELSQIDVGSLKLQREPCDLRDLISDTINAMRVQAAQLNIDLQGKDADTPQLVLADSARMQRVLTNLVQNALQHTPSGGTVRIRVEDAGPKLRVTVSDNGDGIGPEELPFIFDSFYRGDGARSDGGAGLGLTIARGIVERHGGEIWATSDPGSGMQISFAIPRIVS
ncbi:MAG: HAMP domain-containing sensor histidine kinase [Thermomicrobiaceae bacterium]